MAQQQTLMVTPVALFANVGGKTEEKGNCSCALVGTAMNPPRFNLVCYNEQRVTLCSASITSNNEQSIKFQMQTAEYATFTDNSGASWSVMFLRSADIDQFCANIGTACFGAAAKPSHNATLCDLSHPNQRSQGKTLKLGDRCKVRFSAFDLQRGETDSSVPLITRLLGTNGDILYNFASVQSAYSILPDGKGFENAVVGMVEDTKRVVVVPASVPRSCHNPYGSASIVFVIHLQRILAEDVPAIADVSSPASNTNGALVPVQMDLANSTANGAKPDAAENGASDPSKPKAGSSMDPTYSGVGVPAEHMAQVQKIAANINSTVTQLRDLEDKVAAFNEDWKQTVNRPKPSLLTSQSLEQQVKSLVMENERVRDEISRRDELIRSIEERNRDLQKRMDKAAQMAQVLLDEKQATVSSTGDLRLEQDRAVMKLQENITKCSTERDDINRHLDSVKKMLDMSDHDLRDVKGKHEVLLVQIQALTNKLDAAEDQLGEERSRRKALEAKTAAVNEEIRQSAADSHMKNAQSQDLSRKMESDRLHHLQLMEDERQRRAIETQQLRSEILNELTLREEKFQADRARVSEDNFSRGQDEGREIGKKNAAIDVEAKVQDLQLEAQRAKTELDAYKTQVRASQEEAMAENRRLEAIVSTHKNTTDGETHRKAQNEFKLQNLKTKVRNAEDGLFVQATNCAHRIRRPIAPDDLLALFTSVKDGQNPDFSFQSKHHEEESQAAQAKRLQWITEEMESQYQSRQSSLFHQTYLPALSTMADEVQAEVQRLWKEREEAFAGELLLAENGQRFDISKEEETAFAEIVDFHDSLVAAQKEIIDDETQHRAAVETEFETEHAEQFAFMEEQKAQRQSVEEDEDTARGPIVSEEAENWLAMNKELEEALFAKIIAEQQEIIVEETPARDEIASAYELEAEQLATQEAEGRTQVDEAVELRLTQEREQLELQEAESPKRDTVSRDQEAEFEDLASAEKAAREEQLGTEARALAEEQAAAEAAQQQAEEADRAEKEEAKRAANAAAAAASPLGGGAEATNETAGAPLGSKQVFADDSSSDSDSDGGFGFNKAKSQAPPKKSSAVAAKRSSAAASKLFDSEDSDDGAPAPTPAPKRKPSAPKKAPAKLFDSDDE